jgi:hypothetical protein
MPVTTVVEVPRHCGASSVVGRPRWQVLHLDPQFVAIGLCA